MACLLDCTWSGRRRGVLVGVATAVKALRRARFNYDYDDYAHLARVAEWSAETIDDGEGSGQ